MEIGVERWLKFSQHITEVGNTDMKNSKPHVLTWNSSFSREVGIMISQKRAYERDVKEDRREPSYKTERVCKKLFDELTETQWTCV